MSVQVAANGESAEYFANVTGWAAGGGAGKLEPGGETGVRGRRIDWGGNGMMVSRDGPNESEEPPNNNKVSTQRADESRT
jgi:hypothetical protein